MTISDNENGNNNDTNESEIKNCKMKKITILRNYNKKSLDCVRRSKMKKRDNNIGKQALKAGWTHKK